MDRLDDYRSAYDEDTEDLVRESRVSEGEEGALTGLGLVALAVILWFCWHPGQVLDWLGVGGMLPLLVMLAALGLALLAFFGVANGVRRLTGRRGGVDLGWSGSLAQWRPEEERELLGGEPENLATMLGMGLPGREDDGEPDNVVVYDLERGIGVSREELDHPRDD